jgi:hypothetical protein
VYAAEWNHFVKKQRYQSANLGQTNSSLRYDLANEKLRAFFID